MLAFLGTPPLERLATALTTSLAGTFASAQQRHVPNALRRQRSALLSRGSTQASACPSTSERSLSPMCRASRANALHAPPAPAEARAPVLPVLPSHPPHRSGPDACSNARAAILSHSRLRRTARWLSSAPRQSDSPSTELGAKPTRADAASLAIPPPPPSFSSHRQQQRRLRKHPRPGRRRAP